MGNAGLLPCRPTFVGVPRQVSPDAAVPAANRGSSRQFDGVARGGRVWKRARTSNQAVPLSLCETRRLQRRLSHSTMIGRADIEGSKSNVAMYAWLPQASYPCGTVGPRNCFPLPGSEPPSCLTQERNPLSLGALAGGPDYILSCASTQPTAT